MDISFILVNYKRPDLIFDCISSIKQFTKQNIFEIIVVDNSSEDVLKKNLRSFRDVIYIDSKENLGFGKANNLGVSFAKGKYIYLLNSDTLLLNDSAKILFDYHEMVGNVGILCGNLYDINHMPNHTYGMVLPSLFSIFIYRFHLINFLPGLNERFNITKCSKKVKQIVGANMFLRRDLFNSIAGFDSNIFMYVEDTDLSIRVSKLGLDLINIPEAKIIHLQGASSLNSNSILNEINSYIYFFSKHKSLLYTKFYIILEIVNVVLKKTVFSLRGSDRYRFVLPVLFRKLFN